MLEDLPFEGTTKVVNKGVDVAVLVTPPNVEMALQAAKVCGVCGVSTAVLNVTELHPVDRRTLLYFCETTGGLVFESQALLEMHQVPSGIQAVVADSLELEPLRRSVLTVYQGKKELWNERV